MKKIQVPANVRVRPPALVAHRGYALRYPENTLESLRAAVSAGAGYIEFDVQMTADHAPVLLHDSDLWRTGGDDRVVMDMNLDELWQIEVNEDSRLHGKFSGVRVPTLEDAAALIAEEKKIVAFVELKVESMRRFGTELVVDKALEVLQPVLKRCVIISFDPEAVERARERGANAIGWVLPEWTAEVKSRAQGLKPEYLFCNYRTVPDREELWTGPWRWALYEIIDPELALALAAHGARFVETMAIGEMLHDRRLVPGRRRDD